MSVKGIYKTNWLLLLHQWLFSLNIGFAVAYALFAYEGNGNRAIHACRPVREILDKFGLLLFRFAPLGTNQPRSVLNRNFQIWELGFLVVMLGLGLVLFLILRRLAQYSATGLVLSSMGGIAALTAVPGIWLYMVHATWNVNDPGSFWRTYGIASTLEIIAVGLMLYLIRKRAVNWSILAFALHYIFWVIVIGRSSGIPVLAAVPLSLVVPSAGFAWLLYIRALSV